MSRINIYPGGAYEQRYAGDNGGSLLANLNLRSQTGSLRQVSGQILSLRDPANSSANPATVRVPAATPVGALGPPTTINCQGGTSVALTSLFIGGTPSFATYPLFTLQFLLNSITVADEHPYGGQQRVIDTTSLGSPPTQSVALGFVYTLNFDQIVFRNYIGGGAVNDIFLTGLFTTGDAELPPIPSSNLSDSPSVINSIQYVEIQLAAADASGTAVINPVVTTKTVLVPLGPASAAAGLTLPQAQLLWQLNDSTHVTLARLTTGNTIRADVCVVEYR